MPDLKVDPQALTGASEQLRQTVDPFVSAQKSLNPFANGNSVQLGEFEDAKHLGDAITAFVAKFTNLCLHYENVIGRHLPDVLIDARNYLTDTEQDNNTLALEGIAGITSDAERPSQR